MLSVGPDEMTLADKGYADPEFFVTPRYYPGTGNLQKAIMARHETANGRFKQFGVLGQTFRHHLKLHSLCFYAVVNLVQFSLENGSPLYSIEHLLP